MTTTYSAPNESPLVDMILPLARIRPSNFNPRKRFDEASLQELADSIREHGLLEPIVVRPIEGTLKKGEGYEYEIVAGERRYRASKLAGLLTIPSRIHPYLDDAAALRLAIIENVQRQDLDPVEEAEGYRQLANLGMKQREIAESIHRSQPAVANAMRILDLPEGVLERIRKGELTASHGVAIAAWKDFPAVASKVAELAVANKWTTKQAEKPLEQGWAFTSALQGAKLIRDLYEARFDRKVCQKCPFEAYRNPSHSYGYCFKPEHFDELNEAAKVTQEAERQERIQAALAKASAEGKKLPNLSDLQSASYEKLSPIAADNPTGCTESCAHRGNALGHSGEVLAICTDPAHYRKLKAADTRAEHKAAREEGRELLAETERRIDALQEIGPREIAVIAMVALEPYFVRKEIEAACNRQGLNRLIAPLRNERYGDRGKELDRSNNHSLLAKASAVEVGKIVLEAILRSEISRRYVEHSESHSLATDFYLGAARAKPCKLAGLPCDPATCVQRCPKAEAIQEATHEAAS